MNARLRDPSIRDKANRQHCQHDDQGRALCAKCRAVLGETETILCDKCSEILRLERLEAERAKRELERVERIKQTARRALSGVPLWPHARVDSPDFPGKCRAKKLQAFARRYAPSQGPVALLGSSGKGKTTACVALVHRLVDAGVAAAIATDRTAPEFALAAGIVWTTARALVMVRRSSDLGEEPELLNRCRTATLLIVDEWGSEAHDRDGDLMSVVDDRYSCGLPTIITSGMRATDFEQRYGEHVLRRVSETGVRIEEFA